MGRTNIEEESWKRIYRLAEIMCCDVRMAAGTTACLWSNSQDLVKTHGTREEILEWANLFKLDDAEASLWLIGLQKARFISVDEYELYEIHGNKVQLEHRIINISRASKGGQALKKKLSDLKRLKAGLKPAYDETQAGSKRPKTRQDKTRQDNTKQDKTIQSKTRQYKVTDSEIDEIYKIYPRKEGKLDGYKIVRREIQNPEDLVLLKTAVQKYSAKISKDGTEPKFVKHFSTFMNAWRECLDVDYGTAAFVKKAFKSERDHDFDAEMEELNKAGLDGAS